MKKKASSILIASTSTRTAVTRNVAAPAEPTYQIQVSDFKSKSAGPLIIFMQSLLSNTNGDARFDAMNPTRIELTEALDALITASGISKTIKSRQNTETTQTKLLECVTLLESLCVWILATFPNDNSLAKIAGFKLYKMSRNRITPATAMLENTRLAATGDPSTIIGSCKAIKVTGKILYTAEISEDDGKTWRMGGSSSNSRSIPVSGIRKAVPYLVRFYSTTTGGKSEPSYPSLSWVGQ